MLKTKVSPKTLILLLIFGSLFTYGIHGIGGPQRADRSYWPKPGEKGYEIRLEGFTQMNPARLEIFVNGHPDSAPISGSNGNNRINRAFGAVKGTTITVRVTRTPKRSDFNHRVGEIRCLITENTREVSRQSTFDPYEDRVNCAWVVGSNGD